MRKVKKKTTSQLKKELDSLFSKYIRQKYSDGNGYSSCYTCGAVKHWKELQCGHFASRIYLNTRYDERNCRPQCYGCNMWGKGKVPDFATRLEKETPGIVAQLFIDARKIYPNYPYQEKIDYYKKLIK